MSNIIKDGIAKEDNKITSFLMIGQSNMAGRGDFGEVDRIINDKCFMLRMGRWQTMSEPINVDRDVLHNKFHSGVCLAASFADDVSKHINGEVGLIPCADGGTRIAQWQPGEALFDHAVMQTKLALRNSKLGGIIWHQGESDCGEEFDPKLYRERFLNTVTCLRKELNAEHLPLIIGEISYEITDEWKYKVNSHEMNALLNQLKDELPFCDIASSKGLPLKPDGIHFNSASLREFGHRYFEKYKQLSAL